MEKNEVYPRASEYLSLRLGVRKKTPGVTLPHTGRATFLDERFFHCLFSDSKVNVRCIDRGLLSRPRGALTRTLLLSLNATRVPIDFAIKCTSPHVFGKAFLQTS